MLTRSVVVDVLGKGRIVPTIQARDGCLLSIGRLWAELDCAQVDKEDNEDHYPR